MTHCLFPFPIQQLRIEIRLPWKYSYIVRTPATCPMLLFLQGTTQELIVNRLPLLTPLSELQPVPADQRPLQAHIHQFHDFGARGEIRNESEGTFHWRFDLQDQYEVEDIVGISSSMFTNQFGDRVYARIYINSDGSKYQANAVSVFLVTMARRKNSLSPINYHTTIVLRNGYFSLVPMDPHTAFLLGRDDSVIQAVYGCQNCVSVTELLQSITGGTVCLGVQFLA